ncbi:hypothetical protein VP01_2252g4 [Puccinia sorghi]|uniref:Uncharacterized protein n=1 Tax=Puccinia sorghi TaxID=27349 RepID=A0A0L6V949_9BASI|nr:hypothetical protein VP01_2252g4 [Puccinia sorghi]
MVKPLGTKFMRKMILERQYHKINSDFHQRKNITPLKNIHSIFSLCHQSQNKNTGIMCKHQITQFFTAGKRMEPREFHLQWHLKVCLFFIFLKKKPAKMCCVGEERSRFQENKVSADLLGERKSRLQENEDSAHPKKISPINLKNPPLLEAPNTSASSTLTKSWMLNPIKTLYSEKKYKMISRPEVYNRLVFQHSRSWSQTLFPSTTLPNNNPPIFIGMRENRNFVVLKIKDDNLFPGLNWRRTGTYLYPRGNGVEK